ncbi:hypothetical protein [Streptomyces sp. DSM 15324]|nr:hypothetical protein [Streptomyces sp. DSM 15324]
MDRRPVAETGPPLVEAGTDAAALLDAADQWDLSPAPFLPR